MTGILMISSTYPPDIGGVETHLHDLVSWVKQRKHKIVVVTFQPYKPSVSRMQVVETEGNAITFRLPRPGRSVFFANDRWNPVFQAFYLPTLLLFCVLYVSSHRKEIDVVHAHGILSTPIAFLVSKPFKKRCVMSLHHTYIPKGRVHKAVGRIILSLPDKVLCLSNKSRLELLRIGVQEEKLQTFTYWVDQTLFRPLDKDNCKKLLKFEERFVILFVGRLTEEKGVRVLLSVAKKLGDTLDNAIFAFVGIGPLAQEVIDASKHVRNVRFQGVVSNKDTPLWYNASDVLVVPSIHEEGFGRIILESLACGTPVIAFNVGGVPEALDTSVGILAQPTAESLTNAITYLYNNPDALMKLTEKCRPYAQKRFSEDNARLIEQAYFAYSK